MVYVFMLAMHVSYKNGTSGFSNLKIYSPFREPTYDEVIKTVESLLPQLEANSATVLNLIPLKREKMPETKTEPENVEETK